MTPELRPRVHHLRRQNPYQPISVRHAVDLIRDDQREPSPAYPFLSDLQGGPCSARGEIGPLSVDVEVVHDADASLGDDDVTGTFTNTASATTVANTRRNWGSDSTFYELSTYRRQQTRAEYTRLGMSKSVATEAMRFAIDQDMRDDASRTYHGLIVTLRVDDRVLAETSLWGIDTIDGHDGRGYFIQTAEELLEEALREATADAPRAATAAQAHADRVTETALTLRDT